MSTEKEMPAKLVEDSTWLCEPRPDAIAVPDFIVSRHELLVLLKYWAEIKVDVSFFCFSAQVSGGDLTSERTFAAKRINRIADALADEESVKKALHEVYETYAKQCDGLVWKVFSGKATPEEEGQFNEEQARILGGDPEARAAEDG